jgi:hypothetical protein
MSGAEDVVVVKVVVGLVDDRPVPKGVEVTDVVDSGETAEGSPHPTTSRANTRDIKRLTRSFSACPTGVSTAIPKPPQHAVRLVAQNNDSVAEPHTSETALERHVGVRMGH